MSKDKSRQFFFFRIKLTVFTSTTALAVKSLILFDFVHFLLFVWHLRRLILNSNSTFNRKFVVERECVRVHMIKTSLDKWTTERKNEISYFFVLSLPNLNSAESKRFPFASGVVRHKENEKSAKDIAQEDDGRDKEISSSFTFLFFLFSSDASVCWLPSFFLFACSPNQKRRRSRWQEK